MSPTRPTTFALFATILVLAAAFAGCAEPNNTGNNNQNTQTGPCDPSKTKVAIGLVTILSGDAAALGQSARDGARAYIEVANSRGGVNGACVELVERDSQLSVEKAVQGVTELAGDPRIKGIVGPLTSDQAQASLNVANTKKVVLVSPSATRPNLTGQIPYFFRTIPSDAVQGPDQANIVFNDFGAKQVAVVFQQNAYGAGLKDSFVQAYRALGGTIQGEPTAFDTGKPETYAAKAIAVRALNPTFVVVEGQEPDSAGMIKALRDAGYTGRILTSEAVEGQGAITTGGSAMEGVYFTKAAADLSNPDYTTFANKTQIGAFTAQGYDAALVLVEAMRAVGADGEKMRAHIAQTTFDGTVSADKVSFNQQGDLASGRYQLYWIQNGQFVPAPDVTAASS
ncbi:MAG TPA: branched-chain amino acid ABC transporter substrate-binding protein [Candidatus Thermoplasmatota archaeon]|nr:branched-chain amino acid ABC transporter substrate-binding protein [Candidatus Thermoplasmatota archaeon]